MSLGSWLLVACYFPLALPFFIDLHDFSIISQEEYIYDNVSIPFPVGAITLSLAFAYTFISSVLAPKNYIRLLSVQNFILLWVGFLFPLCFYYYFVSGLGFFRIVQLVLPLVFLSGFVLPEKDELRKRLVYSAVLGGGGFFLFHFLYLVLTSDSFFEIDEFEYTLIFNHRIYQSLVSYPGVLSIYFFLFLAILVSGRKTTAMKSFALITLPVAFVLIFLAARRVSMFELTAGLMLLFVYFSIILLTRSFKIKSIILFFLLGLCSPGIYYVIVLSPMYHRSDSSIAAGEFDSGRLDIYREALSFFISNPMITLVGAGGSSHVGYHNYFLDTIYRVGVLGLVPLCLSLVFLFSVFLRISDGERQNKLGVKFFVLIISSCMFIQVMVNSAITQPYYLINFYFALFSVVFYLFNHEGSLLDYKEIS